MVYYCFTHIIEGYAHFSYTIMCLRTLDHIHPYPIPTTWRSSLLNERVAQIIDGRPMTVFGSLKQFLCVVFTCYWNVPIFRHPYISCSGQNIGIYIYRYIIYMSLQYKIIWVRLALYIAIIHNTFILFCFCLANYIWCFLFVLVYGASPYLFARFCNILFWLSSPPWIVGGCTHDLAMTMTKHPRLLNLSYSPRRYLRYDMCCFFVQV